MAAEQPEEAMQRTPENTRREIERAFVAQLQSQHRRGMIRQGVWNVMGIVVVVLLWELTPRLVPGINVRMFPPPSEVVGTLWEHIVSGALIGHAWASVLRAAGGFVIGVSLGVVTGLSTGRVEILQHLTDPVLHSLRSIPTIAFVPLSIVWLGLGELPKVALIAWGTFFPVYINTFLGVRNVPLLYLRSGASLGANAWQLLWRVVLPASLPFIAAGLRQSTATAFVILVAAELVGASQGIGFLISFSHLIFRVDLMFVGLFTLGGMGFVADRVFTWGLVKVFPWWHGQIRS